jgi:putative membrane protein
MSDARRLHPATIWLRFVKGAPSTLIGLPALLTWTSGKGVLWIFAVMAVVGAGALALSYLRWRGFRYRIGGDEVVIEQGLLNRSRRSIPLERIQDVSIERGPLARLFGLALVRIETGGGDKDEGLLDSVGVAEAQRLRAVLRGGAADAVAAAGEPAEPVLFAMGPGRLALYGMFGFSLVWLALIFSALQTLDNAIAWDWHDALDWLGIAREQVRARFSVMAVLLAAAVALLLGVISGLLTTVARDYGFRLTRGAGRLRVTKGLLTRSEVVVAMRRIQLALVQRGPVSGRLGWNALRFQTLGGSDDPAGRQNVAPFARAGEVEAVIAAAGLPAFDRPPLRPVSSGHILRSMIRNGLAPLVVILLASPFFPLALAALVLLPVPVGIALLRRRFHRYGMAESSLQVMRGVLSQRDWIVPYASVQVVTVRQTLLQRALGLASVLVDTAGASGLGGPDVIDVSSADAVALAEGLLARA